MKYKTIAIPEEAHKALFAYCKNTGLKAGVIAGKLIIDFVKKQEEKNAKQREKKRN